MIHKWLNKLFKKKQSSLKKNGSLPYLLIILAIGVVLMVFGNIFSTDSSSEQPSTLTATTNDENKDTKETLGGNKTSGPSSIVEYERFYASQLKGALEDAYGMSNVTVKVNVSSSKKKIVEKDHKRNSETTNETDKQGGSRKIEKNEEDEETVMTNREDGEQPFVIGTEEPEINGVVVTAGGADNARVESWIMEAAHSLLGVPEYRIAVIPKKRKGIDE